MSETLALEIVKLVLAALALGFWALKKRAKSDEQKQLPSGIGTLGAALDSASVKDALRSLPCGRGEPCANAIALAIGKVARDMNEKIDAQTDEIKACVKKHVAGAVKALGEES